VGCCYWINNCSGRAVREDGNESRVSHKGMRAGFHLYNFMSRGHERSIRCLTRIVRKLKSLLPVPIVELPLYQPMKGISSVIWFVQISIGRGND